VKDLVAKGSDSPRDDGYNNDADYDGHGVVRDSGKNLSGDYTVDHA
jgi:hypothetical protein